MITVRLHIDCHGEGWAVVQCPVCWDVQKYPALDAFDAPVVCTNCGRSTMVRDALSAWRVEHPDGRQVHVAPVWTLAT